MKPLSTVLAFDDGPHKAEHLTRHRSDSALLPHVPLVGVTCQGSLLLHVGINQIEVDGLDATARILDQFDQNPHRGEIRSIFINSLTLGGFNFPDAASIHRTTGLPVVCVPDTVPKSPIAEVYARIFPDRTPQITYLRNLPPLETVTLKVGGDARITRTIAFHAFGISRGELIPLLRELSVISAIPEPLRLAHLIASAHHYSPL